MKRLSIGQVVRSGCFSIANGYIGRQDSAPWIVMIREKKMEKYWAYRQRGWLLLSCIILTTVLGVASTAWIIPSPPPIDEHVATGDTGHYLYVATAGIRDYLGYRGHGLLVFDINDHHKFVKRISTKGFHEDGSPSNVKGIAVSVPLNSVYLDFVHLAKTRTFKRCA